MRNMMKKLWVEALEARDVPAQWYTVTLDSPAQGVHGDSALAVADGGLTATSNTDADGTVWAENPEEAIRTVLAGRVSVGAQTYEMRSETLSTDPSAHMPFLLVSTPQGYQVRLEDLAGTPQQADWDYNDTTWNVSVTEYANPPGKDAKPAPTPKTAPGGFDPQTIPRITTGKVDPQRVDSTDRTKVIIGISGGHTDKSLPTTVDIVVGKGTTAERTVTVTLTPVQVDKTIDPKAKAHEVKVGGTVNDPGPPPTATPEDAAKYPKITSVVDDMGRAAAIKKTLFPTDWDQAKITRSILEAVAAARKGGEGTTWTPNDDNPNKGKGSATIDGVKIQFDWEFKVGDGKLIITHARPEV